MSFFLVTLESNPPTLGFDKPSVSYKYEEKAESCYTVNDFYKAERGFQLDRSSAIVSLIPQIRYEIHLYRLTGSCVPLSLPDQVAC